LIQTDPLLKLNSTLSKYVVEIEKLKIEGPQPTPRIMQTAVFYKKFIAVFGGKNDKDTSLESHCLNDIMFLDIDKLKWETLVIYGFIPSGRWGHVMGMQKESLLIFGGVTDNRMASSAVYTLELDRKVLRENLEECKKIKIVLECEAKRTGLLS